MNIFMKSSLMHSLIGIQARLCGSHTDVKTSQRPKGSQRPQSGWYCLQRDQKGAVAITFAIFLLIILAVFLFSSDMARHNVVSMRLQNAVDASLLSAASKYESAAPDAEMRLEQDAGGFFAVNFPSRYFDAKDIATQLAALIQPNDSGELSMTAQGELGLWSAALTPVDWFALGAFSAVELPGRHSRCLPLW